LIIPEEIQKEISVTPLVHETVALMTKTNAPMHNPGKWINSKVKPICSHCGISGHTVDKCYRVHGFPPGFKFTKNQSSANSVGYVQGADYTTASPPQLPITLEQCQQLMAFIQHQSGATPLPATNSAGHTASQSHPNTASSSSGIFALNFQYSVFSSHFSHHSFFHPSKKPPWIVDTGATDHMVCSISFFTTITSTISTTVQSPNGAVTSVTHIGTIKLSKNLILNGVLCVPSFTFNSISARKLIKHLCCCLIFLSNYCFIQNLSPLKTIGVGKERNGLYFLMLQSSVSSLDSADSSSRALSTSVKASSSPADIWHYRLGHPSSSRINLLHDLVSYIPCDSTKVCTIFPLAKQHRLPFAQSTSITCSPFDLIHVDIWEPFSTSSINGSIFFLTIVDET
jgi:hypothetical protein